MTTTQKQNEKIATLQLLVKGYREKIDQLERLNFLQSLTIKELKDKNLMEQINDMKKEVIFLKKITQNLSIGVAAGLSDNETEY